MASKLPAAGVISEEGGAEAQVFGSAKGEPAGDGYWTIAGRSHCNTHVQPSNRRGQKRRAALAENSLRMLHARRPSVRFDQLLHLAQQLNSVFVSVESLLDPSTSSFY